MKPDTDKYEQMQKKGNKKNVKIKERKKNDIAMLKVMKRQNREQQRRYRAKQTNKTIHPIKEMNEKIKVIQKENEKRKDVIRTQSWGLRIKLQKDNTEKQSTVPEENPYNSRSKYDREKKEQ